MFSKIKILYKDLTRQMPLENNFRDYDEYWKNRGFHAPSLNRAKAMSKYIGTKTNILDIGCGDGTVIKYLSENNNPNSIIGIDISKAAVKYVKEQGYEAYEMDVLSKDFIDFLNSSKGFDYIIITEVLEHIQDPETLITAIKEHVKKSVFISIPNAGFFVNRIRFIFGKFPLVMIQQHVKEHIRFWTRKDFYYWVNYHGYSVKNLTATAGMGVPPLKPLEKFGPGMFAKQIMYEIIIKRGG